MQLDATDRGILEALSQDGRLPNNALAAQLGIAPSTCLTRVRQLQERGVIRGFHADIDPKALGRELQAMIAVRVQTDARSRIADFQNYLIGLPGVLNVFFLAGSTDFQVHVAVADSDGLRDFVVQHLSTASEVAMTETSLIFEHITTRQVSDGGRAPGDAR